MELVVTLEHRFVRTPNGAVWTQAAFARPFWTRYLDVFELVRPVARVRRTDTVPSDWVRADGPQIVFVPLPYYVGPRQYLQRSGAVKRVVRAALAAPSATILRVPSQLAVHALTELAAQQRPYGVEVVGDPHDVFAPGAVLHPLRPYFRWSFARKMRVQCAGASAAAYVTAAALQERYPASDDAYSTNYSSVVLPDAAFAWRPQPTKESGPYTLVFVGTMAQLYKAPDVLIDSVARCVEAGLNLKLIAVGDGQHRASLERRVAELGLASKVTFAGQLTAGRAVRAQLDRADVFILPSRQEGLPRAMIEAMARGLPCIGSTVGGIPELLPPEDMVPPDDPGALARLIAELLADPARRSRMATRNLQVSRQYHEDVLRARRVAFFQQLMYRTLEWEHGLA